MNHTDIHTENDGETNLVETWLTFDLPRVIAGFLAGIFAGIIMAIVAGGFATMGGLEFFYPIKLAASPLLGDNALNLGIWPGVLAVGALTHLFLCGILGAIFAHFTQTNAVIPLLGAGFMWGTFAWIFINNLFSKSFQQVMAAHVPAGAAFFIHLAFGFSLVSIRVFDRWVCGRNRS